MSNSNLSTGAPTDTTFRTYSPGQVQEYARQRGGYPPLLIDEIIKLHASTGGAFESLLDLGCGPGSATRDLAAYFDHAVGMDPSPEMIRSANEIGGTAKASSIQFIEGEAELCEGILDNSVDLISAATSPHWFDMENFWPTAARVLKPGGTVAFFTIWRTYCNPNTTLHADEVHRIIAQLEQVTLAPYQRKGNWSMMGLYHDLQMPWNNNPPCPSFPQHLYRRQLWNEDGAPFEQGGYMCLEKAMTFDEVEKMIATISAVTRWREDHPELALTEKDCVKAAVAEIRRLHGWPNGQSRISMVGPTVLVTLKKG